MSAPDTNIHTQEHRHRGPLAGIKGVLVFVAVLLLLYVGYLFMAADFMAADDRDGMATVPAVRSSATVDAMPVDPVSGIVNGGGPVAAGAVSE